MKNLRWKVITVIGLFAIFFGVGIYPILATQVQASGAHMAD